MAIVHGFMKNCNKMTIHDWNTVSLLLIAFSIEINCLPPGYSYTKFMKPVSGAEKQIEVVHDDGQYRGHDYVAKPDYSFAYVVEDPKSNVHQSRQETRNGDTVQGQYSVLDPDGKYRTVKYTADKKNGFQASVITDGQVVHHTQEPVQPVHDHVQHYPQQPAQPKAPPPPPQEPHHEEGDDEYADDENDDGQTEDDQGEESYSENEGDDEEGNDDEYADGGSEGSEGSEYY